MEALIEGFTVYYGLDWIAMVCGLYGTYLIGRKSKYAFIVWIIAGFCGLTVAILSSQYGFLIYNIIVINLYFKNFVQWIKDEREHFVAAE